MYSQRDWDRMFVLIFVVGIIAGAGLISLLMWFA